MLERRAYPLILMDCQMPVLDGYQTTTIIRQQEAPGEHVPIIAVTAHALPEERAKVLAIGMDDYTSKPISQQALAELLERWWPGDGAQQAVPALAPPAEPLPPATPRAEAANGASGSDLDPNIKRSDRVVRIFLSSVPRDIVAIESAISAGDSQALKHAAHRLKGGCLAIGVPRMASVCVLLEGNPANRAELLVQLGYEFERVKARVQTTSVAET
jgi:two-component system, sensor histidine kinase and response regulator